MHELGKTLIFFGAILLALGLLFTLGGKLPFFGKLPGDILVRKKDFTFYFPLATSLAVSVILSLVFWLLSKKR
jgi:hypothetical protein